LRYAVPAILGSATLVSTALYWLPLLRDRALWPASMVPVALLGWVLTQRGHIKAATTTLAIGIWLCTAGMSYMGGGVTAPVQFVFTLIIFSLGWLSTGRVTAIATAITCAFTIGLVVLESQRGLPLTTAYPAAVQALVQVCVFLMCGVLMYTLVRAYRQRLIELESTKFELNQAQALSKVGSWVVDLASGLSSSSDETCRILGVPPGTTIANDYYLEHTHPDDRDILRLAWARLLNDHTAMDIEHRILVHNSMRWVRQRAETDRHVPGQLRVLGTTQDINERKLAELSVQESERKFSTAFQSSPVAASIVTLFEGRFLEANDKYERDFGWTPPELRGRTTEDIGLWADYETRQRWVAALTARGSITHYETVWTHKNGSSRSISIAGELIEHDGIPCILAYITDITDRKAAEDQIHSLAFFDPLTSLPNRRLLMNRLEVSLANAQRYQRRGGLLFIDLDNFKTLNDTHGHDRGDQLLQRIALRLSTCIREGDTVSRLGGDEFVIMLDSLSEDAQVAAAQAEATAAKVLAQLDQNFDLEDIRFHSSASIGVTLYGPEPERIEEPLKRADTAMYQAKNAGRNTIRFFDPQMQASVSAFVEMEMELRHAVADQQFVLFYQPQVNAVGHVVGSEALVRWNHAERGLVSPLEFIRVAEKSDLILHLGSWILGNACQQLAVWASDPALAHLSVAVNVSARQFQQPDFVQQVLDALHYAGAKPTLLKLELTESMLIDNVTAVIEKMTTLKAHGVRFALDDFGTGYSSLSYLKQLPLDQLKIDRSFVRDVITDPNDAAIARMVIVLADTLGLTVVAEGVETAEQQALLLGQGCQHFQGFYFSRPLALVDFEAFVRNQQSQ
jgi:diguanylate cyclase (GGDEF)-like protein/PAS domain S-box-containing protein